MGDIVAAEYVSLDGVTEDPGGETDFEHGGWSNLYWSDELASLQSDLLFASDALLLGRVTYDGFAAAWPRMEHEVGPFAERMNAMPKFVVTRTPRSLAWNATSLEGDAVAAVADLKRRDDQRLLLYGSGSLLQALLPHGLIDRYRLMVHPVVLGAGRPLFPPGMPKSDLRLVASHATDTGVLVLDYEPAR